MAPVATLGTKVDQMADDFASVATNVADLVRRMNALDSKLGDISSAIRTLSRRRLPRPRRLPQRLPQIRAPARPPKVCGRMRDATRTPGSWRSRCRSSAST